MHTVVSLEGTRCKGPAVQSHQLEQTNVSQTRAGQGQAGSKCQHQHAKNAFCPMKPTDKESESIESTSTSEIPSMQCHRQLSAT